MKPTLINLRGVTGLAREETFQGRPHVVVPVVALMEAVIWPVNAKSPEFVPVDVLSQNTSAWNGHPVVMNHPMENGEPVSANQPHILESVAFGTIFHTSGGEKVLRSKKLEMEAWLDIEAAGRVGGEAQRVLERVRAGENVEVSVGAMVALKDQRGAYQGRPFSHVWTKITPDHLAMLSETDRGACSVAMGCGTNRVASARMHVLTSSGLEPEDLSEDSTMKKTFLQMLRGLTRQVAAEEGISDVDLRRALDKAINAVEPAYWGIVEAYHADNVVIYQAMPEDKLLSIRRSFTVADDGSVTLNDDRQEVEPVTEWKPVAASDDTPQTEAPSTPKAASCGCGGSNPEPTGGSNDMDKNQRIAALIANPASHFAPGDEAVLAAFSDERLSALEAALKPAETPAPVTPAVTAAASGAPAVEAPVDEAKWLAGAPQSVRDAVARDQQRIAAEKTAVINVLKGAVNGAYTEAELTAMPLTDLQRLSKALGATTQPQAVDFALAGAPRAASQNETIPPPPSLNDRIKANRAAK
jgi:hypothetical protein